MKEHPELLLVDKPKGITSFDVIRQLRRRLEVKKMGHAGTLDPLATGLMIIGIGAGTKRLTELTKLDKEYLAEVLIGERRSTSDMEGEVVEEREVMESVEILQSKISTVLTNLIGTIELPVSAYSAIKVDGVPMYKRARQAEKTGDVVTELVRRTMRVYEAELFRLEMMPKRALATIRFKVGSGTYIRSLAEELGRVISYPATIYNLRRIRVGGFDIDMAKPLADI